MDYLELDERTRMILNAVVSYYIANIDPVGSRTLCKQYKLGFSPATIRNVMADLEDMGYLQHPHTSAGRVPTEKGYRFYVDELAKRQRLRESQFEDLLKTYAGLAQDKENLFEAVCRFLSATSNYIGVLLSPRLQDSIFRHIDFIRLRHRQVLVIFVGQTGIVQQRIIEVKEDYPQDKLDQMARCLNEHLKGLPLCKVRDKLLKMMEEDKNLYDRMLQDVVNLSREVIDKNKAGNVYIDGQLNILNQPEFSDIEKMKEIFRTFEEKSNILCLLDSCMQGEGVRILIGSENKAEQMRNCSLVTATYSNRERVLGTLGVIGPTRMRYSHVIPLVEYTAKLLTDLLSKT